MSFNSFIFFIVVAFVWAGYRRLGTRRTRAAFLLAASYLFYAYWDWRFTGLLAASTLVDFSVGRRLGRTDDLRIRKAWVSVSLAVNLGILGFFKYFGFFAEGLVALARTIGLNVDAPHYRVLLPLGISFYTFRTLSYTIDVYRRRLTPTDSLLDYALFVSFFPSLVAGPIDRAGSILPQIASLKPATIAQVKEGLALIVIGLVRKVLIGDAAGRFVDNLFGQPGLYRSPELLAGLLLYSIQVYADFSGYSYIARGVAKLFGVELMKNFEQPYFARSFSEFWRRWHISLSSWIWDYIFNPLMSSLLRRVSRWNLSSADAEMRVVYPVVAISTMLLCGLWHGADVAFLVWGGIHGVCLAVERLAVYGNRSIQMRPGIRSVKTALRVGAGWLSTQAVVVFGWLFFRAGNMSAASDILSRIVHWEPSELAARFAGIVVSFAVALFALDAIEYSTGDHAFLLRLRAPVAAGVGAALTLTVFLYMATTKPMPFVYFQF